jgi:hypothetical protein
MDAKKALRVYRGPDNPAPFRNMIEQLSFKCRLMANTMTPNSIQKLSSAGPKGKVTVMRVGALATPFYGMEYVFTEGGEKTLYIVLIASEAHQYSLKVVSLKANDYLFDDMIKDTPIGVHEIYDGYYTTATARGREACPFILREAGSFVSVASGSGLAGSKYDDWHYHYALYSGIPPELSASDEFFRPPGRTGKSAGGKTHYSMVDYTAIGVHFLLTRYIEQVKRNYFPHNTTIVFGDALPNEDFEVIKYDSGWGNLILPANVLAYYGKRPYTYNSEAHLFTSYGESIIAAAQVSMPSDLDLIQFFWPFIPYMSEVGHFGLLGFSSYDALYGMASLSPVMGSLYTWNLQKYLVAGGSKESLVKLIDTCSFVNPEYARDYSSVSDVASDLCYTGTITETIRATYGDYISSGSKYIPIGTIGNQGVCYVKTDWSVQGSGPVEASDQLLSTTGNIPIQLYLSLGSDMDTFVQYLDAGAYQNQSTTAKTWSESARNQITLSQQLIFGDDIIATGSGDLNYSMTRTGSSNYAGSWSITVTEPPPEICVGSLGYTTQQMTINTSQDLTVVDPVDGATYTWSVSGVGTLTHSEGTHTHYNAPASNPECVNGHVTLSENGVPCETLHIAVTTTSVAIAGWEWTDPAPECTSGRTLGVCHAQGVSHLFYRCTGADQIGNQPCVLKSQDCTEEEAAAMIIALCNVAIA